MFALQGSTQVVRQRGDLTPARKGIVMFPSASVATTTFNLPPRIASAYLRQAHARAHAALLEWCPSLEDAGPPAIANSGRHGPGAMAPPWQSLVALCDNRQSEELGISKTGTQ